MAGPLKFSAGRDDGRLFDPEPRSLAAKLHQALVESSPGPAVGPYDYQAANDAWLAFHHDILERERRKKNIETARAKPSVCVCIPYFNKARYFPELLSCLEAQTLASFSVVAVDDGSSQPAAKDLFDAMARKYEPHGWVFLRQENAFVDAARNRAARQSDSEYLFFIDADDLIPPHAIERMLGAAVISGVDCLVSASVLFTGDEPPYTTTAKYMPIGANLVAGLIEPIIFGGPMILVRRKVFEAIGGYREVRGAAHEDWELQARLAMQRIRYRCLARVPASIPATPGRIGKNQRRFHRQAPHHRLLRGAIFQNWNAWNGGRDVRPVSPLPGAGRRRSGERSARTANAAT